MGKKIAFILLCFVSILSPFFVYAGVEVIQTGVASPQSASEEGNIEQLRKRALRNAMDLAVMQVTGAEISSERGGSLRQREDTVIHNDQVDESIRQQRRHNTAVRTRTEGHARLLSINREWQGKGQYYVEATFLVDTPEEILASRNAGYYWQGAGQPSLGIEFTEEVDGEERQDNENHTLRYLRDNLTKNDLTVSTSEPNTQYLIKVHQSLQAKELVSFGTLTMNCRMSFQIIDQVKGETLTEYRASHGPDAGFTMEQARERCLKAIAPKVSAQLVRKIAKIMNDRWNNGVEQQIFITNVPGRAVPKLTEVISNLFQVTTAAAVSYNNGIYQQKIRYKGTGGEFSQAIQGALADEDWIVHVVKIDGREIRLNWVAEQ